MPAQLQAALLDAAPTAMRARDPSAALIADAGPLARAIAALWPRPHAAYFAAHEPARRRLAALIATFGNREGAAEAAPFLAEWSLRRLIDAAFSNAPAGLAEALKKLDGKDWTREDYHRLLSLLRDGDKMLRHAQSIDRRLVAILAALPAELRRPRLVAQIPTVECAALIARGVKRLRHSEGDERSDARLAARLERARSSQALFRMLIDEIGLDELAPPPVPGTKWFVPIASASAIERAALRFENCLKGRIPLMLLGRAAYYEVVGDEPAVVEIVRDRMGLWVVGEIRGHANCAVSRELWERICAHLTFHGAHLQGRRADNLAIQLAHAAGW